ncbi:N-acyl amino acid synthase FeeM domain-containing protein [Novipirellula artificiosorum]|uniref:N-acyl amino acid synthase FeeM catalytic core domain-containing protein n=1 Tax=Novipirellula artificiosorum TaxID=2528016 RepID=A0A5C6DR29_9BACT|nr:long-chain N-acyl amino acid synthase [Novipirellula artificiosorum]TWU39733.1 hypothetical protein Poly41_25890 [Novipirellula artificiosorum]
MFTLCAQERSTTSTVEPVELSIARTTADLEDAFRLAYRSYLRSGLTKENPTGMRLTPYHFLPTTEVMLAKLQGISLSTATLILDGELGLPAEAIYASEIDSLRNKGLRLAEVGCLADQRESPVRFLKMFRQLSTLIAQAAANRGCNGLIAATHPKHAKFYIRHLGFEIFGDVRACPYAQGNPAVALLMDFEQLRGSEIHTHLFGKPYSEGVLQGHRWDVETHDHFQTIWQQSQVATQAMNSHSTDPACERLAVIQDAVEELIGEKVAEQS